jgi:hypothetical protein
MHVHHGKVMSECSCDGAEHENAAVIHGATQNYNRHVSPGKATVVATRPAPKGDVVHGNSNASLGKAKAVTAHTASKGNLDHGKSNAPHGKAKVVGACTAPNCGNFNPPHGEVKVVVAAPTAPKVDVDHRNSNKNHVEQNPVFNIQVPVTTSVTQMSL